MITKKRPEKEKKQGPPLHFRNYEILEQIGHGSFGKVRKASHALLVKEESYQIAIKELHTNVLKKKNAYEKLEKEIQSLYALRHQFIYRLFDVCETVGEDLIFLVMEYLPEGLEGYFITHGRLKENELQRIFGQLVSAMAYCHEQRIVHRDLKIQNIMLTSHLDVKVIDFGFANYLEDGEFLKTSCGSLAYAAPELLSSAFYAGPEVDAWSAGVILYWLAVGTAPFDDSDELRQRQSIKNAVYTVPSSISEGCSDLIQKILCLNPCERILFPEMKNHPWLSNANFETVSVLKNQFDDEIVNRLLEIIGLKTKDKNFIIDALKEGSKRIPGTKEHNLFIFYEILETHKINEMKYDPTPIITTSSTKMPYFSSNDSKEKEVVTTKEESPSLYPRRRDRFILGLESTRSRENTYHAVVGRIIRCFRKTRCSWAVLPNYRFFGRWRSLDDRNICLHFSLQLFLDRKNEKYVLDIQKLDKMTPVFAWMDFIAFFNSTLISIRQDAAAAVAARGATKVESSV